MGYQERIEDSEISGACWAGNAYKERHQIHLIIMKILMICTTLWGNNLVRAYPFYKKLSEDNNVLVAGWLKKDKEIYKPYRHLMNFFPIKTGSVSSDLRTLWKESKDADLIYCFKGLYSSIIPSYFISKLRRIPLMLDFDDLDYEISSIREIFSLNFIASLMIKGANAVTCQSNLLQKKYGGTVVRTGTDFEMFNPNVKGGNELRKKLALENKFIIIFTGAPREHKGIDTIIEALNILKNKSIVLLLVGNNNDKDCQKLIPEYERLTWNKECFKTLPPQPFDDMPKYLAMADAVVLPQKQDKVAEYQVPAKIYDAMAMGKSLIVSNIGDMPELVDDAGLVFNAGDTNGLAEKIKIIYSDKSFAKELGRKARQRCIDNYSWDILKKQVLDIYKVISR